MTKNATKNVAWALLMETQAALIRPLVKGKPATHT